jgi:hypothetical protein
MANSSRRSFLGGLLGAVTGAIAAKAAPPAAAAPAAVPAPVPATPVDFAGLTEGSFTYSQSGTSSELSYSMDGSELPTTMTLSYSVSGVLGGSDLNCARG